MVKLGPWGSGDHGSAYDITVAPQRLESISLRYGKIIDSISFSYRDREGKLHTAGPWGGTGGVCDEVITLGPHEYVTEVVVGMFARADQYLDAIGFYVLPF